MTNREKKRRWIAAWRIAGPELEKQRVRDVSALSDEDALRQTLDLLSIPSKYRAPHRRDRSGLIEQQRLFQHARFSSRTARSR